MDASPSSLSAQLDMGVEDGQTGVRGKPPGLDKTEACRAGLALSNAAILSICPRLVLGHPSPTWHLNM